MKTKNLSNDKPDAEDTSDVNKESAPVPTTNDFRHTFLDGPL
jgi:hypothetical protein